MSVPLLDLKRQYSNLKPILVDDIGRHDEALITYRRVVERSTGPLVQRAQRRIDEIRFGVREDERPTDW